MLKKEDIEHLGELARIGLSDDEQATLVGGVESVLGYVSRIASVSTDTKEGSPAGALRNVLREDGEVYPGGEWSERIIANAPRQESGYIKVEQIL
jgi:aspartyl/glutamyl-tRNA(Asn/Gln) amidotransferase C subunit